MSNMVQVNDQLMSRSSTSQKLVAVKQVAKPITNTFSFSFSFLLATVKAGNLGVLSLICQVQFVVFY